MKQLEVRQKNNFNILMLKCIVRLFKRGPCIRFENVILHQTHPLPSWAKFYITFVNYLLNIRQPIGTISMAISLAFTIFHNRL